MISVRFRMVPALALFGIAIGLCSCPEGGKAAARADPAAEARALAESGSFEAAARAWEQAEAICRRGNDRAGLVDALLGKGAAEQALGRQRLAVTALVDAVELARKTDARRPLIAGLNLLGVARTFSHAAEQAEGPLREAEKLARQEGLGDLHAAVWNSLGILLAGQGKHDAALEAYRQAAALAAGAQDARLVVQVHGNMADCALHKGDFAAAARSNGLAQTGAARLAPSHAKAYALAHCGKTWESLFAQAPEHEQALRRRAFEAYQAAAATAETCHDDRALAYALGYTGHLYEQEKKYRDARVLTHRAAFLAQQARSPESLYLWEWQTARLDTAEGHRTEAIASYRRAIRSLSEIRNDLSARLGNANSRSSFREAVGDVYFELADLLLQQASGAEETKELAALVEARDTCETLKSVELEDYFQDDCVSLLKAKIKPVEKLAAGAAVIYLIPLKDRTEILLSTGGRLRRLKAAVGAEQLTATVRAFRVHLETRTTEEYREEAGRLYDWLIRPLEPMLKTGHVDTLVFIPDGALRTIPMAALSDGKQFLIQKYAIAVSPGLTLMEAEPIRRTTVSLMVDSITLPMTRDGVQFPALPYVKEEVAGLRRLYGGTSLMDDQFKTEAVRDAVQKQPFSIVHIASHGEFTAEASKSFILTFDDRLGLNDLEQIIRPAQLRDKPVELLTLSACQTAAGDDRAALGLAGVAVKAGARSALATLWYVNDEASTTLVTDFYTGLQQEATLTKARALQRAQVKLLTAARTSHPCLWAPYLLIGNWL